MKAQCITTVTMRLSIFFRKKLKLCCNLGSNKQLVLHQLLLALSLFFLLFFTEMEEPSCSQNCCSTDQVQQLHNGSVAETPAATSNVKEDVEPTSFSENSTCNSVTVIEGEHFQLECYVRGHPEAKIEFREVSSSTPTTGIIEYTPIIPREYR